MSDTLIRIKRAVLENRIGFSRKALDELEADCLTELDAMEAIMDAPAIHKTLRSRSPRRGQPGEKLYVVIGLTLDGIPIYTKGRFLKKDGRETFYFLISSKRSTAVL